MSKIFYLIVFLFIVNCNINKVEKFHGVHYLDKKQQNFILLETNTNDLLEILGPPSTKSTFDNDLWIYIERIVEKKSMLTLGKNRIVANNVLILEVNSKGLLITKNFYDINKMNKLSFSTLTTEKNYSKQSFIYNILSSLRQKVNDPLGKRKSRNK
jgi:outer membrane protein assembly factor BamE (lipoprotein component of BamABCDE complex)